MRGRVGLGLAGVLLGAAVPGQAARIDDRFYLSISAFKPRINTTLQVDVPGLPGDGTVIDMENDLGMADSEWLPAFEAGARLGNRFRIEAEYYRLSRSSSFDLRRDIVWEDVTYSAGVKVDSSFDTTVYRGTLGYSFVKTPEWELGADLGAHVTEFAASISGAGSVNGIVFPISQRRQEQLVPLPDRKSVV